MNTYFGQTHENSPNSIASSENMTAPWKPPGAHNEQFSGNSGYYGGGQFHAAKNSDGSAGSKLKSWGAMAQPVEYAKNGHQEFVGAPFTPGLTGGQNAFIWNESGGFVPQQFAPNQQPDPMLQQTEAKFSGLNLKANVFHPSMPPHQQGPPGHFTPPVELVNGQWGRAEINQATPWNFEMNNAGMPEHAGPPQNHRYRKWEQQPREEGVPPFGQVGFGGPPTQYGMHVYGGGSERMLPPGNGAPFPPQFGGPPGRGPPNQRWDNIGGPMGGGSGKFGVGDLPGPGTGANAQPRGGGPAPAGLFTSGPPPPLHSMGMMPPRHGPGHIIGHMPPPPLLPPLNPHGMGGNIGMSQFVPNGAMQPVNLNEDSVWQDPNGDLRKWQRDTGTSIWGDPAKQTNMTIARWQQFTADEVVAKSSILSKDTDVVDQGWGELPPIGANATSSSNNHNNPGNNSISNAGGNSNQFMAPAQQQQQTHIKNQQRPGNGGNSWGQDNQMPPAGQGWDHLEQHSQQQQPQQCTASLGQFHGQSVPGANATFMLPPSTTASQQHQSNTLFQAPPSLLSSLIDPITGASTDNEQQQSGSGQGAQQRKTASPNGTGQQQQPQQSLKVSLAEELSSFGSHGLGGGPIW